MLSDERKEQLVDLHEFDSPGDVSSRILHYVTATYGVSRSRIASRLNISEKVVSNVCDKQATLTMGQLLVIAKLVRIPLTILLVKAIENDPSTAHIIEEYFDFKPEGRATGKILERLSSARRQPKTAKEAMLRLLRDLDQHAEFIRDGDAIYRERVQYISQVCEEAATSRTNRDELLIELCICVGKWLKYYEKNAGKGEVPHPFPAP